MTTVKRCFALVGIGLLGSVGAVGLVVNLLHPIRPDVKEPATNGPLNTERFASDSQHNRAVRAEIEDGGVTFLDKTGIRTWLCPGYTRESPLVEILAKIRDIDGSIRPFPVERLVIAGVDGGGIGSCGVRGVGLRLQIDSQQLQGGSLVYDKEYRVRAGYRPGEDLPIIFAMDSAATFRTPAHLDKGEIYRVELILLDKPVEQAKQETARRVADEEKRVTEEESLRISATYPHDFRDVTWAAVYMVDDHGQEGYDHQGGGQIVVPGPNPLNGELLVCFVNRTTGTRGTWCYVGNLQKRILHLPNDADFVVAQEDLVPVHFNLQNRDAAVAAGFKALALYLSPEAQLPLFVVPLSFSEQTADTAASSAIEVLLSPGTFHVRAILEGDEQIPLSTVTITSEIDKVYTFEFPTDRPTRAD